MKLTRLLTLKALKAIQENSPELAVKTILTGFSYSGSLKNEPMLLNQLIRISMNQNFTLAIREMLAKSEPSETDLARLQKIVEESYLPDPVHQGFLLELKGWYLFHNKIENGEYLFSEDQHSFYMLEAILNWLLLPIARSDTNFLIDHMDQIIEYSDLPPHQRALQYKKSPLKDEPYFFQIGSKSRLKHLDSSIKRGDLANARCCISALAIALRRFRIAKGSYPDSLEALVPSFVSEVPIDPFSGKSFLYARTGEGFLLQSDGEDPKYTDAPVKMDKVVKWKIEK